MSVSVSPKDMEKEEWLKINGKLLCVIDDVSDYVPEFESFQKGHLPVVLSVNGPFSVATIAHDKHRYLSLVDCSDGLPRSIYSVSIDLLYKVSPGLTICYPKKFNLPFIMDLLL
jgi:hypothetical protein